MLHILSRKNENSSEKKVIDPRPSDVKEAVDPFEQMDKSEGVVIDPFDTQNEAGQNSSVDDSEAEQNRISEVSEPDANADSDKKAKKVKKKKKEKVAKPKGLEAKFSKKMFFLKQCYRSQIGPLMMMTMGLILSLAPDLLASMTVKPDMPEWFRNGGMSKIYLGAGLLSIAMGLWKIAIARLNWRYEFKEHQVKSVEGIIAKKKTTIAYQNILTEETDVSILGRLMGFGNIELLTAGSAGSEIIITNVLEPEKIIEEIRKRKHYSKLAAEKADSKQY